MTLSDQFSSYLEVITYSIKDLTYHIPLASCFGGHAVTLKIYHQHVMRSLTQTIFPFIPKLEENPALGVVSTCKIAAPLLPSSR